jgi:hypothetical protein
VTPPDPKRLKKVAIWENDGTPEGRWFYAPGEGPPGRLPMGCYWLTLAHLVLLLAAAIAAGIALVVRCWCHCR